MGDKDIQDTHEADNLNNRLEIENDGKARNAVGTRVRRLSTTIMLLAIVCALNTHIKLRRVQK